MKSRPSLCLLLLCTLELCSECVWLSLHVASNHNNSDGGSGTLSLAARWVSPYALNLALGILPAASMVRGDRSGVMGGRDAAVDRREDVVHDGGRGAPDGFSLDGRKGAGFIDGDGRGSWSWGSGLLFLCPLLAWIRSGQRKSCPRGTVGDFDLTGFGSGDSQELGGCSMLLQPQAGSGRGPDIGGRGE